VELYIEYVIIDNFVIDYIILKMIDVTLGQKIRIKNKILVCVLGTVFAIFLPYLYAQKKLMFFYKIFVSLFLVLCIKKYKKLRFFITYYLLFVSYTFLIGGVILGAIQILGIEYSMSGLLLYKFEYPISLFVVILLILIRLVFKVLKIAKARLKNSNFMYEVFIEDKGKRVRANAFFDSGNNVKFDNVGINIISLNLFLRLYNEINLCDLITKRVDQNELKNIKYIKISGIGQGDEFLSFEVDFFEVCGCKYHNARFVLAMKNLGDWDCILHKDFLGGSV